jgi:hypothetical protein
MSECEGATRPQAPHLSETRTYILTPIQLLFTNKRGWRSRGPFGSRASFAEHCTDGHGAYKGDILGRCDLLFGLLEVTVVCPKGTDNTDELFEQARRELAWC